MVSAPMHLQSNTSLIDMPPLFLLLFHDLDLVDPCGDVGLLPTMRARHSFQWPCRQKYGHESGRMAKGMGGLPVGSVVISSTVYLKL